MKILWQSFTSPDSEGPYTRDLTEYVTGLMGPDVEVDFFGIDPPDQYLHRITELRVGAQVVANLIQAESEGYDAVAIGHFQDPGLWDARAAVDIPVLGLGEASMLHSCMFGRRFGLVTISPIFLPWHEEQVHQYALGGRFSGVAAMETSVELFVSAFGGDAGAYSSIKSQFEECARAVVDAGAEVVIPAGGLPGLLFRDERSFDLDGATVLNPVMALAKQAEAAGSIRAVSGFGTSRKSTFALPSSEARSQFVEQLGLHGRPFRAPPAGK